MAKYKQYWILTCQSGNMYFNCYHAGTIGEFINKQAKKKSKIVLLNAFKTTLMDYETFKRMNNEPVVV